MQMQLNIIYFIPINVRFCDDGPYQPKIYNIVPYHIGARPYLADHISSN